MYVAFFYNDMLLSIHRVLEEKGKHIKKITQEINWKGGTFQK